MKRALKTIVLTNLFIILIFNSVSAAFVPSKDVKSLLLMEASTGKVIYEKNSHQSLPPASVTKIMTMLLTCEALDSGELTLETPITASERAKSMGGSTIFLDTNEVMTLDDLLKGIVINSGNDAAVAVAEHLCGSVESFVQKMNSRAKELGMKDTNFVNCNGLDDDNHYTSAYDIALMSRELLKHNVIMNYTTVWMDTIRNGKFQLANTNKLIRFYKGATGLKTGSTSKAGCCISATAKRDGMHLIAVVMGAENSKDRFNTASELLNYGFSNFTVSSYGNKNDKVCEVPVLYGKKDFVSVNPEKDTTVLINKKDKENLKTHINVPESFAAPIKKGDILGEMVVTLNGETLTKTNLVATENINKKNPGDYFLYLISGLLSA